MHNHRRLHMWMRATLVVALLVGCSGMQAQPKSGDWKVPTRFGQFVFTVASNRAEITKLATTFSSYTLGGITQSGTITSMPSPGWQISNNQFTINDNISPSLRITINGTFVSSGDQVSGTWTVVVNGQTDAASWGPVILTSVEEAKGGVPERFSLAQNYPNPFNPSTTIEYELPKRSSVSLKIFNTLGQLVATLTDELKEAGYNQATWNASDVPSGVYFYRLQAGECVETKKMIVLK